MNVKRKANTVLVKLATIICYFSLVATENGDELASGSGVTVTDPDIMGNNMTIATDTDYVIGNLQVEKEDSGVPSPDTGLYLMSQEGPSSGRLKALSACGFLLTSYAHPPWVKEITLTFQTAGYQLVGNSYERHTDPYTFYLTINVNDTFGCDEVSFPVGLGLMVSKGDRAGVFIQRAYCNQFAVNSPLYTCPAHVNMIDPVKNCSQTLYFNNTRDDEHIPDKVNILDGNPVNVFINLDLTVKPDVPLEAELLPSTCAKRVINHGTLSLSNLAALLVVAAVGVALFITVALAVFFRRKRKVKNAHEHHQHTSPGRDQKFPTETLTRNEYSLSVNTLSSERHTAVLQVLEDHYETDSNFLEEKQLKNGEYDYANVEHFWEPANQESGLKEQLFCLKIKEIAIEDLEIKEQLGSGQFATVNRGVWRNPGGDDLAKDVAVKCLKGETSEEERIRFLQEAAIMGQFEHPNILQILATSYDEDMKPILIVDLMHIGDLHHHLQSLRPEGGQQVSHKLGPTLLSYSRQVAFGMHYLSCKKFVHRDLAARNVLVANDGTCKIADFGLSRNLQNEDYYISQGGKIPVKWTAPEALHYRKYSTASDVWSYGCLLYEIWSLGHKPFSTLNNAEVLKRVASGYRLPPPPGCPKEIYDIMIQCWNPDPALRVSFLKIVVALQHPDYKILSWSPKDTHSLNENARCLGAPLAESECLYKTLQRAYCNINSVEN